MKFLLIFLVIFLLFLNYRLFPEKFSESSYPVDDGQEFVNNSRSNDYYFDNTGLKGYMYNASKKYESKPEPTKTPLKYKVIDAKLDLYHSNCNPEPKTADLPVLKTKYRSNNIEPDFIDFNKGIIL